MKAFWSIHALALAGCLLAMSNLSYAGDDPSSRCVTGLREPPPAYPLPAYSAHEIAMRFVPPRTNAELLSNLKIVVDERLLAQPAFFEDEVLRVLFNTNDVQWVKPGTPDVASERVVKPTRIARIRFESSSFAGMKAAVGVNHKCLDGRPHPSRPGVFIPAHAYDSGYISIRVEEPVTITLGDVRRAFGSNAGELDSQCRSPIPLYYPGPKGPSPEAFRIHEANFRPSDAGYKPLCRAATPGSGLPDEYPVSDIWIRLVEEDYTLPDSVIP